MPKTFSILITDVNPHVRNFLKREFQNEGYTVYLAKNGAEAEKLIFSQRPLDLMIFDPEIPEPTGQSVLRNALDRIPPIEIIIHTYPEFYHSKDIAKLHFVEKNETSIHLLLEKVSQCSKP